MCTDKWLPKYKDTNLHVFSSVFTSGWKELVSERLEGTSERACLSRVAIMAVGATRRDLYISFSFTQFFMDNSVSTAAFLVYFARGFTRNRQSIAHQ